MTKEPSKKKRGRGGARPGAGRPRKQPEPRKHHSLYLTESAFKVIKTEMLQGGGNKSDALNRILLDHGNRNLRVF